MKKNRFKRISLLATTAVLALTLAACNDKEKEATEPKGDTIKIGAIEPLSGASASLGENSKKAIDMAVEEINANGGIKSLDGKKLEVVYGDSQGKPPVGVSEAERLLSEGVTLLTGAWQSGVTLPASEVAEKNKKIWLASVPSDDSITERGFQYVYRLADTSKMRVQAQVNFLEHLSKKEEIKTVAVVYENTSWGSGVAKQWQEQLPAAGFKIVLSEGYDANAADLTPVVTKVKKANADAVLMVSYMKDATLLTKGFVQQKVQPKVFLGTSGGFADSEFIKNAGKEALGFFDIAAWESDVNRPFSAETNEKFKAKYGYDMNGEMVKEYVGVYTIADVLERAASTDSEKLKEAFKATSIKEGPTQMYAKEVHFDEKGTLPDPGIVIVQFKEVDGQVQRVTVYPTEDAREGAEVTYPYVAK